MEVLITSKTHKGHSACVGGLVLQNKRFVRLLNPGLWDQPADTDLKVGDIWDIRFIERVNPVPPHVEDVIVQRRVYTRTFRNISDYLRRCGVKIYHGSPTILFEGRLGWTSHGSGYISKSNIPEHSVGFWICDLDLSLDEEGKHYNYFTFDNFVNLKRLSYVGFQPAVPVIPKGTLMRVSLARWWSPDEADMEKRCYLQLSGWYGLPPSETTNFHGCNIDPTDDDLPF